MNLRTLIKSEGREIKWVANQLGITPMTLRNKRKNGSFSEPEVYHLARAFNLDVDVIKDAIKNETQTY